MCDEGCGESERRWVVGTEQVLEQVSDAGLRLRGDGEDELAAAQLAQELGHRPQEQVHLLHRHAPQV